MKSFIYDLRVCLLLLVSWAVPANDTHSHRYQQTHHLCAQESCAKNAGGLNPDARLTYPDIKRRNASAVCSFSCRRHGVSFILKMVEKGPAHKAVTAPLCSESEGRVRANRWPRSGGGPGGLPWPLSRPQGTEGLLRIW